MLRSLYCKEDRLTLGLLWFLWADREDHLLAGEISSAVGQLEFLNKSDSVYYVDYVKVQYIQYINKNNVQRVKKISKKQVIFQQKAKKRSSSQSANQSLFLASRGQAAQTVESFFGSFDFCCLLFYFLYFFIFFYIFYIFFLHILRFCCCFLLLLYSIFCF